MRAAGTAVLLIACLCVALAVRLRGHGADPAALPVPPGLGRGRPALSTAATLAGELRVPACPRPIGFAVIPAHEVSVDPGLVAAEAGRGRTVVVYDGSEMPRAFTAQAVDALYLAHRLARSVGLGRLTFGSAFVVRFAVPPACDGLPASDLVRAAAPSGLSDP